MKWIKPVELPKGKGVTRAWRIETVEGGDNLGTVKWWPAWRKYAFFPEPGKLFEPDCLRDLADFCETQTTARKAERAEELKGLAR